MVDRMETRCISRLHRQRAKAGFAACFDNLATCHTPQEVARMLRHELDLWLEMNPKVKDM